MGLSVCDPVQGDDGRLYCRPELPRAFRDLIVPLASVLTPNQFEAELITGIKIESERDAVRACEALHQRGPHTVVITSAAVPSRESEITIIASTTEDQHPDSAKRLVMRVPRVKAYFTGTGDLFTALLLAWLYRSPGNLKLALEMAVGGLQAVLRGTVQSCGDAATSKEHNSAVSAARELRLVENQNELLSPTILYHAEQLQLQNDKVPRNAV